MCNIFNIKKVICKTVNTRGRVDDLSFFEYLSPFGFFLLNFIVLFPFLIKYNHILFIIIVF